MQQLSALETLANCALDTEQDHLGQLMPLTIPTLQNITKVQSIHSPGEPKVLVNLDSKEFSELANPVRRNYENQCQQYGAKQSNSELPAQSHPFSGEHAGPSNYEKNNFRDDFDRSLMGNFLGDSVTVNTKEARWELRNLFNDNGMFLLHLFEFKKICDKCCACYFIFIFVCFFLRTINCSACCSTI